MPDSPNPGSFKKTIQPVRGTSDLLPADKSRHNHVIRTAERVAGYFGYADMATPIFEFSEVFSRPLGDSSDVVQKETYHFEDRGGSNLTLRPEGTAAAMRAVISNGLTQSLPLRWFYAGPMFRYERPQKGRMRQFHQIGCELIGEASPLADAEIIACGAQILEKLGVLKDTVLHINSLGDAESRAKYREALIAYLSDYRDKLSEDSQRRLETNPLRILDSKSEQDQEILKKAPSLNDFLTTEARAHFKTVLLALQDAGIDSTLDVRLVRGLDYYSHTAFEFITDKLGAQGTVLGGGRYDGLCETLGGPPIPAVGFAAGIDRLALLAQEPTNKSAKIALISTEAETDIPAFVLANKLRAQGGGITLLMGGNVKKKMKNADKENYDYVLMFGPDEARQDIILVKDMATGTQQDMALSALIKWLQVQPS